MRCIAERDRVLSGIIFINRNGLRWYDAPKEYGPSKTLYNRWKRWSVPAEQVKDRMNALDARRIELEAQLSREPAPSPIRIHPKMAASYRAQVGLLIAQLQQPEGMLETKEALRGLIDQIVLTPDAATGRLSLDLEGALARLLWLAVAAEGGIKRQKPAGAGYEVSDIIEELVLVAGACNRRNLPQLKTAV